MSHQGNARIKDVLDEKLALLVILLKKKKANL